MAAPLPRAERGVQMPTVDNRGRRIVPVPATPPPFLAAVPERRTRRGPAVPSRQATRNTPPREVTVPKVYDQEHPHPDWKKPIQYQTMLPGERSDLYDEGHPAYGWRADGQRKNRPGRPEGHVLVPTPPPVVEEDDQDEENNEEEPVLPAPAATAIPQRGSRNMPRNTPVQPDDIPDVPVTSRRRPPQTAKAQTTDQMLTLSLSGPPELAADAFWQFANGGELRPAFIGGGARINSEGDWEIDFQPDRRNPGDVGLRYVPVIYHIDPQ